MADRRRHLADGRQALLAQEVRLGGDELLLRDLEPFQRASERAQRENPEGGEHGQREGGADDRRESGAQPDAFDAFDDLDPADHFESVAYIARPGHRGPRGNSARFYQQFTFTIEQPVRLGPLVSAANQQQFMLQMLIEFPGVGI